MCYCVLLGNSMKVLRVSLLAGRNFKLIVNGICQEMILITYLNMPQLNKTILK